MARDTIVDGDASGIWPGKAVTRSRRSANDLVNVGARTFRTISNAIRRYT